MFCTGELEFSDQDAFGPHEGPHEIRVKPPPGFTDNLDFIDAMEKKNNPDIFELKNPAPKPEIGFPGLQSSFGQPQPNSFNPFGSLFGGGQQGQQQDQQGTPSLPGNLLAGLTPAQLRQLALLQYLQNPTFALAALGGAGIYFFLALENLHTQRS